MKVLIACEYSAMVRDAFRARGHDAWSCDVLPTEGDPAYHYQDDIFHILCGSKGFGWDLLIAHPPCTHLAGSGARWWKSKPAELQEEALEFVIALSNAPIPKIAIENPVGILSTKWRKPDQIIQPWQYGDPFVKTTCLWTKGLKKLVPFNPVDGREQACWKMPPGKNRWKERSRTYPGIAQAMADQWGIF